MQKQTDVILDHIDVVKLDINLWTSSKKLRPEDLVLADGSKLPPEDLAHLGTKKTIDPEKLKAFNRIKKEAERICLETGTRFIGGFANPRTEIPRITHELDTLSKEFDNERDQFLASYTSDTEEWIKRHSEFGDAIRRAIEPVESVASKLRFDYVVFRVTKPDSADKEDSLDRRTISMSDQLFREIAQDANELVNRSFVGKDTVTARTLNAFRRIRDKLNSLGFLDHRCMPVVDKIDSVLDSLPKHGPYNGSAFGSLFSLGLLLSDPDKIKRHGSGLLSADSFPMTEMKSEDDESNDQFFQESDTGVTMDGLIQQPEKLEITTEIEVNISGAQPEDLSENEIDDLPGFDDFLAQYDASTEESVKQSVQQERPEPLIETDGVTGFMESVQETIPEAVTQPAGKPVVAVKEELRDETDDETSESEELETVTDFWFS